MAGLQLSGLASGFDWKTVVDQLIAIERTPQNRLRTTKTLNLNKLTSFTSLRSRITSLQTAVKALSSDALFGQRSAKLDDAASTWTATAANASVIGEYTFNVATLATKTRSEGATGRAANLHASDDVSGVVVGNLRLSTAVTEGVFTINGEQIEIAATDSLQDVFARIAEATDDAVIAKYDAATDRVSLAGTGAITLGSSVDTSNFLYALKLYNNGLSEIRSAGDLGAIDLNEAIDDAGLAAAITTVEGSGSFVINGTTIAYNVNDDSLQSIINRVNESAAGVVLSYDAGNDRFTLTNKNTGDLGVSVSEEAGGLLGALGLTAATGASVERGDNAVFTVNGGGTIVSASNTFDASVHGQKGLTVTANSTGTQTVTVSADTTAIEKGLRSFIDKFNDVQKFIDEQTKVTVNSDGSVTAAQFANNREFTALARSLRDIAFEQVPELSGTITRLESLGIDFNGASSQLAVRDESKLADALANNLDSVTAIFTTATTGITARLDAYLDRQTRSAGIIDTQENTLESQNIGLDKQIADLDRRLEAERTRLESGFIRMEQAQSLINSQLAALQRTLNFQ